MKAFFKKIVFLAVMLFAITGSAAHQFSNGNFSYKVKSNASLTIRFGGSSSNGNNLGWLARYDKLGYYAVQPDGTYRYETFKIDKFGDGSFDLGEFAAGENVVFSWLTGTRFTRTLLSENPAMKAGSLYTIKAMAQLILC